MQDDNWELINGPVAHEIEVLNYTNQINVIEALFRFIMYYGDLQYDGVPPSPSQVSLKDLHRTGTLFLLHHPGSYRECPVYVSDGEKVIHEPPEHQHVQQMMDSFFSDLAGRWKNLNEIQAAAFVLWRINWIHPFKNGNGRTARAFAYACLCLKFGFQPPGEKTVIDLIMTNRPAFYSALRHADETYDATTGVVDLAPLEQYVTELVIQQLQSIPGN